MRWCWCDVVLHKVAYLYLELQESNVRLRLTVISSAGFGDQINKQNRLAHYS